MIIIQFILLYLFVKYIYALWKPFITFKFLIHSQYNKSLWRGIHQSWYDCSYLFTSIVFIKNKPPFIMKQMYKSYWIRSND